METAAIEYVPSKLRSHVFTGTLCEQKVVYQAITMDKSLFLWIGFLSDPSLNNISIAMQTPYSSTPLVTQVLGSETDSTSANLAARLSKRLRKPVYISFNLPSDAITLKAVEMQISEEIKNSHDKF